MKGGFGLYLIVVFIAVLSGCAGSKGNDGDIHSPSDAETDKARLAEVTVNIPEFPFHENETVAVDKDIIENAGTAVYP